MAGSRVGGENPTRSNPASNARALAWRVTSTAGVAASMGFEYCIPMKSSTVPLTGAVPLQEWEAMRALIQVAAQPGDKVHLSGVLGAAVAAVAAGIACETNQAMAVVVATDDEVRELADDLAEFCRVWGGSRSVLAYLPPDEIERELPSVSTEALWDRLEVLRSLWEHPQRCVVVTTPSAFEKHLPMADWWKAHGLVLERGRPLTPEAVRQWAEQHGYRRVPGGRPWGMGSAGRTRGCVFVGQP